MLGLAEMMEAQPEYEQAELYYEGRNAELFVSQRMATALRQYEARYRLRFVKVPVDAVADRLEIAAVTVTQPADDEGTQEDLTQLLQDQVRDLNDMELEETLVHDRVCMFGDAYIIVDMNEDPETGERTVAPYYNSPYEVRIIYDRSGRQKLFAIKTWTEDDIIGNGLEWIHGTQQVDEIRRVDLFYVDAVESWVTKLGRDGSNASDWELFGPGSPKLDERGRAILVDTGLLDGDNTPILEPVLEEGVYWHDYGRIPVFHFRSRRPYGRPEHEAAYGPQDMIDKLTITQMATVDYQGFPQRYFLQDPQAEMDNAQEWDEDDANPNTISEPAPKFKAGPGEVWWAEGAKGAGQFDVANPNAFLLPLDRYVRAMSTVTNTPFHLFDPMGGSAPSGEERRTKEAGHTKKVKKRQRQYGATWREVYAFCLFLLTGKDELDRIDVRWVPAESIDPAEAWDLANKKKTVGLPAEQIFLEHGYTADEVTRFKKLWEEEQKQRIELQRESFAASFQERRDDRPDRPNPVQGTEGED